VYPVQGDTWLLAGALRREPISPAARVLDLGTGTGALAVLAAQAGAAQVTAVDISLRAVLTTWLNAHCRRLPITVHHGDLLDPVAGRQFDVILSNPPYVPSYGNRLPRRGSARAWDAGRDGRALLDRICAQAPGLLVPGGVLLLVHSGLCGVDATLRQLAGAGLDATVAVRSRQQFGPVLRARAGLLEARGLIRPGQREEELVVIRAVRSR
jgi:release factor glutamine methyltransferase